MPLLSGAITSLGRRVPWVCPVCSRGCALAGTGVSTGVHSPGRLSLAEAEKKRKEETPGPVFCLLPDNHTKLAGKECGYC